MDEHLLDVYPLARKAFAWHDDFYARHVGAMPAPLRAARDRVAGIIDAHVGGPVELRDANIVVALISLDPLACNGFYGDPTYGTNVDRLMKGLIAAAKTPGEPLAPELAPVVTAISIAMMEQVIDEINAGKREVSAKELKGSLHRGAHNDGIYLPNLNNRKFQDLYEITQFAYFSVLERAVLKEKKPPAPSGPTGPVF